MSAISNSKYRLWFVSVRPWSFVMTAVSVAVGCVLAVTSARRFSFGLAALTLLGALLVHAATNLINDYFDTKNGVDKPGAPGTLYRPHPLVHKLFSASEVLAVTLVLYAVAAAIGGYLTMVRGWPVAAIAAAGALISLGYTAGPVEFKYHGLGEIVVFLVWGPLMTVGAYYTQVGSWLGAGTVVWASVPLGIWVALVLLANNLKDLDYDSDTGIVTSATRLGREGAHQLFLGLVAMAYLVAVLGVLVGPFSAWMLLVLLSLPLAVQLAVKFWTLREIPPDADPQTARVSTVFGLLLLAALII
ncbi:MAG: prenyltransferase [Bacillota bacterium]|nr:prenyltransferase [Bacillota bacterium]